MKAFHTITPYLAVKEAPQLIEFVREAFGAEGKIYGVGSEGGIHAEYKIGDAMVMIGGGDALLLQKQSDATKGQCICLRQESSSRISLFRTRTGKQ